MTITIDLLALPAAPAIGVESSECRAFYRASCPRRRASPAMLGTPTGKVPAFAGTTDVLRE